MSVSILVCRGSSNDDCYRVDSLLSKTNMKGFPIVSADGSLTLVGWIDRSEIRYVLERARKKRGRLANTPCLFTARHQDHDDLDIATVEEEPEEYFAPTTAGECVQFWPWVNKVTLCL